MNNVSIYLIADCLHYFDSSFEKYFFLPENLDYSELEDPSILFIPESASSHLSECEHFFEVYNSVGDYLRLVMCIIVVLGLLLNLFVLLVLVVDNTKTSSDVYLMSISLGDISICLGVLFSQRQFFSDSFTAVLGKIFGSLGMFACLTTVMALTVERYCAIKEPLWTLQACSKKRSRNICIVTWSVLLVYCSATSCLTIKLPINGEIELHVTRQLVVFYMSFVLFYFVPVVVSTVLYALILRIVQKREQNLQRLGQPFGDTTTAAAANTNHDNDNRCSTGQRSAPDNTPQTVSCGNPGGSRKNYPDYGNKKDSGVSGCPAGMSAAAGSSHGASSSRPTQTQTGSAVNNQTDQKVQKLMSLRKMTKMFAVVLGSFVVLMSPHRWLMFWVGVKFHVIDEEATPNQGWALINQTLVTGVCSIVYMCNSIVNPLVYNIMAKRFRQKVMTLLAKIRAYVRPRDTFETSLARTQKAELGSKLSSRSAVTSQNSQSRNKQNQPHKMSTSSRKFSTNISVL
ncbi:pyrokinin-1 receptor-like [Symsagittifera roscoffensis]|uniref:pyrokinin-1 receptor-like n=1 Tax=Symsagittifera roscoffensis TaxID=84072 RepID=UPI00307C8E86